MRKKRILVVDDDESLRRVTQVQLQQSGYEVATAASGNEAFERLAASPVDLVLTDVKMPGVSGLELLKRVRTEYPEVVVVVITAYGTVEMAVEAMKAGAYDYVTKPVNIEEIQLTLSRALERLDLLAQVRTLRASLNERYGFESIRGRSETLLRVLEMAARAASADSTVLIRGETGTGKELLAKAIHFNSPRRDRPFVTINCGAIPKDLLESELFGHVRGAFTGAVAHKKGKAELADEGTLFLDEIGEMPPELQVKVLRLIQQGEIEKVGAQETDKVDLRIIAATHRDLEAMIRDSAFREDLYYRLAVIPLDLPPLRERVEDIPELVQHFLVQAKEKHDWPGLTLPHSLLPYFSGYRWPGNIRELQNVVERLAVLARDDEITLADLPDSLKTKQPGHSTLGVELPPDGLSLAAVERGLILRALGKFNWNQTQAARYLDLSRKTLIYRMEKYGIREEQHPTGPPE